jgi:uncharacterized protein (DUF427 family)
VVSSWAVPVEDVAAELVPAAAATPGADTEGYALPDISERPVLDPSIPFAVHTAEGDVVDVRVGQQVRAGAGLRLADPDLDGYIVLDFGAFDTWWEEDEVNVGHPREPFHRIDVLRSSRQVRLELDGQVLAESSRPRLLFETLLPIRFYLPRQDVLAELVPSPTRTTCAYKGYASYWSPVVGGREVTDLAWTYEEPLREASEVAGRVAFSTSGWTSSLTAYGGSAPSPPGRSAPTTDHGGDASIGSRNSRRCRRRVAEQATQARRVSDEQPLMRLASWLASR